jgi:hypothetical protein
MPGAGSCAAGLSIIVAMDNESTPLWIRQASFENLRTGSTSGFVISLPLVLSLSKCLRAVATMIDKNGSFDNL